MNITRRDLLGGAGSALALSAAGVPALTQEMDERIRRKPIPSSGEQIPVVGLGTFRTFDVGSSDSERAPLVEVLREFFGVGGTLIDSSPMYGEAEAVTGDLVGLMGLSDRMFGATKVWTDGRSSGQRQMERSLRLMRKEPMDLMQVHNLRDWREHLITLRQWQEEGRIRYIGITTSNPDQYEEFAEVMQSVNWDFVQLNYNLGAREAEDVLLPMAEDLGMAVLINRPFGAGDLFGRVQGQQLPDWAAEFDCESWAQFFLKFVISHPAATCAIPATSRPRNARDNMRAGFGRLPDEAMRRRMVEYFDAL